MARALRGERRRGVWISATLVGAFALTANLADYAVTLYRSPDLGMEANPLWRNVVDTWGLQAARWYGLSGKALISLLAGQMFAYYLANRHRLIPDRAGSIWTFLQRMGSRSRSARDRLRSMFTLFAFFFAGIQSLYLYTACLNWIEDPAVLDRFPPVVAVITLLIFLLTVAFVVLTHRYAAAILLDRQRHGIPIAAQGPRLG